MGHRLAQTTLDLKNGLQAISTTGDNSLRLIRFSSQREANKREVEKRIMQVACCSCNGTKAICKRCSCAGAGRFCLSCLPSRANKYFNRAACEDCSEPSSTAAPAQKLCKPAQSSEFNVGDCMKRAFGATLSPEQGKEMSPK